MEEGQLEVGGRCDMEEGRRKIFMRSRGGTSR